MDTRLTIPPGFDQNIRYTNACAAYAVAALTHRPIEDFIIPKLAKGGGANDTDTSRMIAWGGLHAHMACVCPEQGFRLAFCSMFGAQPGESLRDVVLKYPTGIAAIMTNEGGHAVAFDNGFVTCLVIHEVVSIDAYLLKAEEVVDLWLLDD